MQLQGKKYKVFLALILCSAWCVPEQGYAGLFDYFKCCRRGPTAHQAAISEEREGGFTPRRSERLKERRKQTSIFGQDV